MEDDPSDQEEREEYDLDEEAGDDDIVAGIDRLSAPTCEETTA